MKHQAQIEPKVAGLYQQALFSIYGLLGEFFFFLVLAYLFYGLTTDKLLVTFFLGHLGIVLLGIFSLSLYLQKDRKKEKYLWIYFYNSLLFVLGTLWGGSFLLLSVAIPEHYTFFLLLIIISLGGISISILAFRLSSYLFFMLPSMGISVIWLLLHGGKSYFIAAAFIAFLIPIYVGIAKRHQKYFIKVIEVKNNVIAGNYEIISRLSKAATFKDDETGMHILRMSHYASMLAKKSGKDAVFVENILYASAMHDVGKIGIPDAILLKPGTLTPEEWDIMKTHTTKGYAILEGSNSSIIQLAATITLTHHEKYDGTGYPQGLKGEQIPMEGRITAIADVYDALLSVRPYKKPWSTEGAFAYIEKNSGTYFDPKLVKDFLSLKEEIIALGNSYKDKE